MAGREGEERKTPRGYLPALIDRVVGYSFGYPKETHSYTTTTVHIPVYAKGTSPSSTTTTADSSSRSSSTVAFELEADLYQPILSVNEKSARGTVLVRSPYGRGISMSVSVRPYAARGYTCLLVSCRGTFGSGGTFYPWRDEQEDGQAVVDWMRRQAWYTGSFATMGGSYLGFTQWALLTDPPQDMVAAVVMCAPHDFGKELWKSGALGMESINWADHVLNMENTSFLRIWEIRARAAKLKNTLDSVPLEEGVKKHFAGRAPWIEYAIEHPDFANDKHYQNWNLERALEKTKIPVLLIGGWYDIFEMQTLEQYQRLSEHNTNVALIMGPWNHMGFFASIVTHQSRFHWIEQYLGGKKPETKQEQDPAAPAVKYHMGGINKWRTTPKWPPPTRPQVFYLHAGNKLSTAPPSPSQAQASSSFTFHPDTCPSAKGGNLLLAGGRVNDTHLSTHHNNILTFTSSALEHAIEVTGCITISLRHTSQIAQGGRAMDLFVRISEVNGPSSSSSSSKNVTETYHRFTQSHTYHTRNGNRNENGNSPTVVGGGGDDDHDHDDEEEEGGGEGQISTLEFTLNHIAHRFKKGNRIRLIIAGGSHPQYSMIRSKVVHTIWHGGKGGRETEEEEGEMSRIVLPVLV